MRLLVAGVLALLLAGCGAWRAGDAGEDPAAVADLRSETRGDTAEPAAALTYYGKIRKLGGI